MSKVIFLNGASSAGKTTLGRALQDLVGVPYLLMGLDSCFAAVPSRWAGGPKGQFRHEGFEYLDLPSQNGHVVKGIGYGPVGLRIMQGFHRGLREIVLAGNPIIVDEMLLDAVVRDHWLTTLDGIDVLYGGVWCELDVLEQRERDRNGVIGLARWSAERVHGGMTYDVDVDTSRRSVNDCANDIARLLGGVRSWIPGFRNQGHYVGPWGSSSSY